MNLNKQYSTLRLILGDQLNANHSWYKSHDPNVLYVVAELQQEMHYVQHHIQKLCAFFASMESFAHALQKANHHVLHLTLDETQQYKTLPCLIKKLCKNFGAQHFEYQRPDEYRLFNQIGTIALGNVTVTVKDTEHFLLPYDDIFHEFSKGKHHKMEFFYRKMRQRFTILMDDALKPLGGSWNYDAENRNKLKPDDLEVIPQPLTFSRDVRAIIERLDRHGVHYFGKADEHILWPTNRQQSLQLLHFFCEQCLPLFGQFQDSMTEKSPHAWSLYHSRLSFALNAKMLSPLQVITTAIDAFNNSHGKITLPQIEGFVRQILGWREFVRAVYWVNMPEYSGLNQLHADRTLPEYFWTANTKMNCMQHAIQQSLDYAYAHHIQRLMVTGNFALLTGLSPDQVDEWYLGIYIDAIEWVEMPNTRGMSQFSDGGIVGTKPYAASGNYINKMSDYCKSCHYTVSKKVEDNACPFNSLYWHFMTRHRNLLEKNPRIGMVYRNWDKQEQMIKDQTLNRANWCLDHLEEL